MKRTTLLSIFFGFILLFALFSKKSIEGFALLNDTCSSNSDCQKDGSSFVCDTKIGKCRKTMNQLCSKGSECVTGQYCVSFGRKKKSSDTDFKYATQCMTQKQIDDSAGSIQLGTMIILNKDLSS